MFSHAYEFKCEANFFWSDFFYNFVFDLLISHGLCLRYNSFGFPEPVTMVLSYFLNRILSNISFQQFQKSLHLLIIDSNI
jgi:hypothetical protein